MEARGTIQNIDLSFPSKKVKVTFEITAKDGETNLDPETVEEYKGKDLAVSFKVFREKRSLSANSYYWVLLGKTAEAMKISTARLHNMILRDHAMPILIGGKMATFTIIDTDEAAKQTLEDKEVHLYPTSHTTTNKNGTTYRDYIWIEGSHMMDSKRFSSLLDDLISRAKEAGVKDIETPDQIARMKATMEAAENEARMRGLQAPEMVPDRGPEHGQDRV